MAQPQRRLFCFGLGYSARVLADDLRAVGWTVAGTCRDDGTRVALDAAGLEVSLFDRARPLADPARTLAGVTHILSSVPPDGDGDPVLDCHGADVAAVPGLAWVGYLSTTGVYGDTGGARVDEDSPRNPTSERSHRRVTAEDAWLALHRDHGVPVHVFRLAGIYGPGRSVLDRVRAGAAQRIDKPGQVFSRIHVDDIAAVLRASMARPRPGAVYNVCDDDPAAPADVVAHACGLLGMASPPEIAFADAAPGMSAMARSFWRDNRRVDNSRIKDELGIALAHPDYRSGLAAILAAEGG